MWRNTRTSALRRWHHRSNRLTPQTAASLLEIPPTRFSPPGTYSRKQELLRASEVAILSGILRISVMTRPRGIARPSELVEPVICYGNPPMGIPLVPQDQFRPTFPKRPTRCWACGGSRGELHLPRLWERKSAPPIPASSRAQGALSLRGLLRQWPSSRDLRLRLTGARPSTAFQGWHPLPEQRSWRRAPCGAMSRKLTGADPATGFSSEMPSRLCRR